MYVIVSCKGQTRLCMCVCVFVCVCVCLRVCVIIQCMISVYVIVARRERQGCTYT